MEKSSKSWTRISLIILVIVVLASIGGGIYIFGIRQNSDTQDSFFSNSVRTQNQTTPSSVPNTSPTQVPLPESGESKNTWETYRTSTYRIQYPPEWKIKYYPNFPSAVQLYLPDPDFKPSSPSGTLAPKQYVTIFSLATSETAVQHVDKIQVSCCVGPSGTATAAASFKKVSVLIGGRTGMAYFSPLNTAGTWNVVLSSGSEVVDIYSSITDLYAVTLANQIINTFVFEK